MRRALLVLLFAVILLPLASAETYRISGKATYADGSAVTLDYVSVQCEQSNFDCYKYRDTSALTDVYGDFTIVIDAEAKEDGLEIQLAVRGESFTHSIDISKHQNSTEGKVYQDLQLTQNPASGVFMGFGCCIVLFVLVFVSVLLRTGRRLSTARGRMEFVGYRPARQLECPKCKSLIVQHELIKHLIVDHDMEAVAAGQLTGKVMRRLWSEEE